MSNEKIINECFVRRKRIIESLQNNCITNSRFKYAHYCVINPINYCSLGCNHCIYSSLPKKSSEKLSLSDGEHLIPFLTDAKTKQIVFSGGGEPFENKEVIYFLIKNLETLEEAIIITNGNFGKDNETCNKILNDLIIHANQLRKKNGYGPIKLILRISRDSHYINKISKEAIKNIINFKQKLNKNFKFDLIIRTTFNDLKTDLKEIISELNMELYPGFDSKSPLIIDGLPTAWFFKESIEIPIIFKPVYSTGRQKDSNMTYSLWRIVDDEKKSSGQFNLSIRGDFGQGHNYYGLLLKGHDHFLNKIKLGENIFLTKYDFRRKQLALYVTADGRIIMNNGSPDNYIKISDPISWKDFLSKQISDPLQNFILEKGPIPLFEQIQKIDSTIKKRVEDINFVFSISYFTLKDACRRFIFLSDIMEKINLRNLLSKNDFLLKEKAQDLIKKGFDQDMQKSIDPIIGNERSIYER